MKKFERGAAQHGPHVLRKLQMDPSALWSWAALIAAALIAFWLTRATEYHQLALGILLSSVTLLILLSLVELVWQVMWVIFGSDQADSTNRTHGRQ